MGKSHKKPIVTDTNKAAKKISHSKFRKRVKQKIQENRFDELPEHEKEVMNQYDVCDHRDVFTEGDDYYEESKRK